MAEAFYQQLDHDRFSPTEHTAGPWSPDNQHLGPPSALLCRAMQRCAAGFDGLLARFSADILGPVPVDAELLVEARVARPGRSLELLTGEITAGERTVVSARAWRIARSDTSSVAVGQAAPLAAPEQGRPIGRPEGWCSGYLEAMEWRSLHGDFTEPGPSTLWVRQRVPLVEGEEPDPVQRLLTVADSGNGASSNFNPRQWWFINAELTVHLQREPAGPWIGLDASTVVGPEGSGTAHSVLHDEMGQVGTGAQALLIRAR